VIILTEIGPEHEIVGWLWFWVKSGFWRS